MASQRDYHCDYHEARDASHVVLDEASSAHITNAAIYLASHVASHKASHDTSHGASHAYSYKDFHDASQTIFIIIRQ